MRASFANRSAAASCDAAYNGMVTVTLSVSFNVCVHEALSCGRFNTLRPVSMSARNAFIAMPPSS